jgi:superkiller protein 3
MDRWLAEKAASAADAKPEDVPSDVREKLRALGYVGTGAGASEKSDRPDPKDKIGSYEDFRRGLSLRLGGQRAEAVAQLEKVVAASPDMADVWEMLGVTLIEQGRKAEGIRAYDRTIALDPTRAEPHLALARLYALDGRRDLAEKHAEIAARREPGKAFETLASLMLDAGQWERAHEYARRSIEADPRRVMSHFALAVVARRAGRFEEALAAYRRAEEENQLQKGSVVLSLHAGIADCLARLGREAEAEKEFRAEIEAIPWSRDGRVGLAMLLRSQGRDADARSALEGLLAAGPRPGPDTYWTIVRAFGVLGDVTAAQEWAARARAKFPSDPRFRP